MNWVGFIWKSKFETELMVIHAPTYRKAWVLFRRANPQLHTSRLRMEPRK